MKNTFYLFILMLLAGCSNAVKTSSEIPLNKDSLTSVKKEKENPGFLSKYPLITWARKSPVEIGCMLQTEFGYKDPLYNCDNKNYSAKGNPNDNGYYEGVLFPDSLISKVAPSIRSIDLDFEHGNLQQISIEFKDSLLKEKIKQLFDLPEKDHFPNNVMDISYGENVESKEKPLDPKYTKWLIITGFEHTGAGD